jgi:hypothetical protein
VEQLFRDLLERLEAAAGESGSGAGAESPALTFFRPRPTRDGVEFILEGAGGRLEFINTLRGFLLVRSLSPSGRGEDLLSVQTYGGSYRPIQKRLTPQESGGRAPYQFTSVSELWKEYLRRARGK